jgi:LysR family transcriptional regulator, benzoate and cis,cis-muconate-responsive activator of ben and cat genes
MQIKALAEKLQTTLFVRNTRYVLLTVQGTQFRDKTRSWLEGLSLTISNINPYSADG